MADEAVDIALIGEIEAAVLVVVADVTLCAHAHIAARVRAEVVDPSDPSTDLNTSFFNSINESDTILVAGEASSHCVANTLRDSYAHFGEEFVKKLVLLEDATSPVTGFELQAKQMIDEMKVLGMKISNTQEWM